MEQAHLSAELDVRFKVVADSVEVAGERFAIYHPQSADDLLDQLDENDDRLPYWAEIWPSARIMAERLLAEAGAGRRLLELGCGVGLVALAAAKAGFQVLATDYFDEALEFTRRNAHANGSASIATRLIDWRSMPKDLGTFDVIVGSDVLYERPNLALVADVLTSTLAPGGIAFVTDPSRRVAMTFPDECRARSLAVKRTREVQVVAGTSRPTVLLYEIRRQQPVA